MLLLHHALFAPAIWRAPGACFRLDPDSGILEARPGGEWRTRRDLHPQPSRRQRVAPLIELRILKLVGGAGNAPVVASSLFCDTGFTGRQPERLPRNCGLQIANCEVF